ATAASDQWFLSQEWRDHRDGNRNVAAHEDCIRGITETETWISANAAALQAASSAPAVEEARLYLVGLRAMQNQLWVADPGGYQARDFGMAELVRRIHALRTPGKKTIIWAWNWHIARRYQDVRGWNDNPQDNIRRQGARAMGSFLSEALGSDYFPIALIGHRVLINSGGVTPPVTSHPEAVEWRLKQLGKPYLLVDLRQPLPQSLLPSGPTYQISQEWGDPYRQFSALLYLENSGPMIYVNSGL
ncbi:MAG TPA: erythromycin esterase family protein, partial [Gemmatimonadaceae bacterium]|nr:erythromycin esterase family protein [Gemmatimonadaceae bacterium]